MGIERWRGNAVGRSCMVAYQGLVWTVANARNLEADFAAQVEETLAMLDTFLREAGSSRERLLSVQVILLDITNRDAFDVQWRAWIGADPQHWPQRAVYGAALAPGLQLEVIAMAAKL